jgi:hypothetical protein
MTGATFANRVRETTTTTGTGNLTLAGAPAGFRTFSAAFDLNINIEYTIEAVDGSGVPTGDWEVGNGYLSGATTFVRDQVMQSSNSGNLVNFSAGTKNIFCSFSARSCRQTQRGFNAQYGLP